MTASDTYTPDSELLTMNNLQVVEYLTATHHEFTRDSMAEISELIEKAQREIENPPSELLKLAAIWFDYSR